ncbi:hypothetical protein CEXT_113791 [Caerostris extrusa]|uniref:Uncharacterized protein n=1 Tax=Caerostris extrusa TaxID=172846 RepID=A0AAV4PIG0_CAEEX|nr:hypothetical protein CEXT_113791 [Caerostris extrusa]
MLFQSTLYFPSQNKAHLLIHLLCQTPLYISPQVNFTADINSILISESASSPRNLSSLSHCVPVCDMRTRPQKVLKKPSGRACFQSLKLHRNSKKGCRNPLQRESTRFRNAERD